MTKVTGRPKRRSVLLEAQIAREAAEAYPRIIEKVMRHWDEMMENKNPQRDPERTDK